MDMDRRGQIRCESNRRSYEGKMKLEPKMTKDVEGLHRNEKGIGWFVAGLLVIGDLAGSGIVALPAAYLQADFYPGIAIALIMCLMGGYCSYVLGLCWTTLLKNWPVYREHCRKPYAEMASRSLGPVAKSVSSVCISITLWGASVVFLLLASKNIHDFVRAVWHRDFSYCYVILIVGACVFPLTILKSPQDFWWVIVVAAVSTMCAVILILVGASLDMATCSPERNVNDKFVLSNYLLSFGTMVFACGGHAAFPTIIHDMRKSYHFHRSSIMAFATIAVVYTVVVVTGFMAYGNSIRDSIINSIQIPAIQQAVNLLITGHCLLAVTLIINPLNQEIEEFLKIPQKFGWQRLVLRSGIFVAVVFVGESIPNFGPLLDLVGATTVTLTSLIMPCLFYLFISVGDEMISQKGLKDADDFTPTLMDVLRRAPRIRLTICTVIIVVGILGGVSSTYSSIVELTTTKFAMPCYVRPFVDYHSDEGTQQTNCCGRYQNISRYGDTSKCSSFKDFYNQY